MRNLALISQLKKEIERNQGNHLESGLLYALNLLAQEDAFEYKPDDTEIFRELLGKNILVEDDYYCEKNILYLNVASYKDKKQGYYYFETNRNNPLHPESCPSSKHRKSVIFTKEDCKNLFYTNLNKWISRNSKLDFCFDFSNTKECFNKTCLFLTYDKTTGYFLLEQGTIKEGSLMYPIEIRHGIATSQFSDSKIPERWFAQNNWSNRICKVFSFCEEDYNEIIEILEDFYNSIN